MKKKIIFHITHFLQGGIETSLVSWLRILNRDNFQLKLSVGFATPDFANFKSRIPSDVDVSFLLHEPWLARTRHKKAKRTANWLERIIEDIFLPQIRKIIMRRRFARIADDCDVIIDYDMSLGRFFIPQKKPMIGFYHFDLAQAISRSPKQQFKMQKHFMAYDFIAGVYQKIIADSKKYFPDIAYKFYCIQNCFDLDELNSLANEGFDKPDYEYIMTCGRFASDKGFDVLISAYAKLLAEKNISEHLVIVGAGVEKEKLLALVSQLGVVDRVHFPGYFANPFPWIKNSKFFVLSSRYEGFGMVIAEALAIGKAVISTDCSVGPMDILDHGKAGILIKVDDQTALKNAMYMLLTNEELRQDLQNKALQRVKKYGAESGNEAFFSLMAKVLPQKDKG